MGICSQSVRPLPCKARHHTHMHAHTRTREHTLRGAKQVFARLMLVCEVKAMHYLSNCRVLYASQGTAICALEALALWSQPGKQAHLHLPAEEAQELRLPLQVMFAAALPVSLFSMLCGRLCTSLLVGGCCVHQNWGHGVGGSQQPGPQCPFHQALDTNV